MGHEPAPIRGVLTQPPCGLASHPENQSLCPPPPAERSKDYSGQGFRCCTPTRAKYNSHFPWMGEATSHVVLTDLGHPGGGVSPGGSMLDMLEVQGASSPTLPKEASALEPRGENHPSFTHAPSPNKDRAWGAAGSCPPLPRPQRPSLRDTTDGPPCWDIYQ